MNLGERQARREVISQSIRLSLAMIGLAWPKQTQAISPNLWQFGWQTPIEAGVAETSSFDFFQQWYCNTIGIKGNQINASNVQISILDTGYTPTDLFLTQSGNVIQARDYSNSGNCNDGFGHGTNACSILATSGAEITSRKVFNDQGGVYSLAEIANAVADSEDSDILVLNFASNTPELKELSPAIKSAADKGVIIFCPAGNASRPSPDAPASLGATVPSVIPTSSLYYNSVPSWFTNQSGNIYNAIYTPGEFIHSINNRGEVVYFNGTSASSTLAAIAMAIFLSEVKKAYPNESKIQISQRSRKLFLENSTIIPSHEMSAGIPNISNSLHQLRLLLAQNVLIPLVIAPLKN